MPTYQVSKSVLGSFNQGNISRFGQTAGTQCACNALFSIYWSHVRSVNIWKSHDMDKILIEGDKLYKLLDTNMYLNVDELPKTILFNNISSHVTLLNLEDCEANLVPNYPFLQIPFSTRQSNENAALIFIAGFTISVFQYPDHTYFLFDSHSRDERGLFVPGGKSCLLKFSNIYELEQYIRVVYLEFRSKACVYFQVQFVQIDVPSELVPQLVVEYRNHVRREQYHQSNKENIKANYQSNREKIKANYQSNKEKTKANYQSNKENLKAKYQSNKKEYRVKYQLNKDHIKLKSQSYYQKNEHAIKSKKRVYYNEHKQKLKCNVDTVMAFKKSINEGPVYICVSCNRCLYRRSVLKFSQKKYAVDVFSIIVPAFDGEYYICKTCDKKLVKKQMPCQSVLNKLDLDEFPSELKNIRRLERVLISKRIIFKKIAIMPKGQSPKLKGAICNVPIDTDDVSNILPRQVNSNGIIIVKLKRKLEYRGHVYFETVRPNFVQRLLLYLKENNPLYKDVEIVTNNIPENLINETEASDENVAFQIETDPSFLIKFLTASEDQQIPIIVEKPTNTTNDELETNENPLDAFRCLANETTLMSHTPTDSDIDNEILIVAPGQGKHPKYVLTDQYCEELAHPHLFPKGRFGYKVERDVLLSPVRYFNQRLLNYTQKFASDSDYIFFANSVMQQIMLNSQINIAMRKVSANNLSAGLLSQNFKETVKQFIANDRAFSFMSTVKGTPAYWKRFLSEVLAMVKQLGPPTYFLTLSCADLRWNELISIICKLKGREISNDEIENLSYQERCSLLNSNPVLVARHFQYRVECFFKEILLDGPLGKTIYYAIRVEFQVRGSPHIHSFIWTENAPHLTVETKDLYIQHIDSKISASLPSIEQNPELLELVKTYQQHRHSKTCRKYKNTDCRFHFGKFFSDRTIISQPLPEEMPQDEKKTILLLRSELLKKVKAYINSELNPAKNNLNNPNSENYEPPLSIEEVLNHLDIPKDDYEHALSISEDNDFHIHLQRNTDSCFVNNYFSEGLLAWEANIDIQPVFNYYKAITYMCAYLSKAEDEVSHAMNQAVEEAYENKLDTYEQMRSVAGAYLTKREVSVQEAVYLVMPELWLRKVFPGVLFANSNVPDKRYRMCLSEKEINELPEDCTDIFKRNMLDRYCDRPNSGFVNGRYNVIAEMCYAEFLRFYSLKYVNKDNDCQPDELDDELIEINHSEVNYPKTVPLMSSSDKLRCRKVPLVLRYFEPNKHKHPENFAHHLLFMFLPFFNELELSAENSLSYVEKLNEPGVIEIINRNRSIVEPYSELVDEAFVQFRNDMTININDYEQQENEEVEFLNAMQEDTFEHEPIDDNELGHDSNPASISIASTILSDNDINARIRSLNPQQRQIFEYIHKWGRDFVKNLSSKAPSCIHPFYIFLTGGAGVGKSHTLTTIYHSLTKLLMYKGGEPDKARILILAPTGVAAVNVDGTTIHSGLTIPTRGKLFPLSDKSKASLRLKLSCIELIMIDEISMVPGKLFHDIDIRLREIFSKDVPFAGKPVLLCGDLYQLPPVTGKPIFKVDCSSIQNIISYEQWHNFMIAELTEVMRQRGDIAFIDLLNQVRIGELDELNENLLMSRFIDKASSDYPTDSIHIFAENAPANEYNTQMLEKLHTQKYQITAKDELPKTVKLSKSELEFVKTARHSETGGLAYYLELKVGARVMITKNIDIDDKLVNGQVGTLMQFKFNNDNVVAIYLKLDDENAGSKAMNSNAICKDNKWVMIERVESTFNTKKRFSNSPSVRRTQFPLMLSWACTCHKVQGLSLPSAVISFELLRQRQFNAGQMYVAISRVTHINGLYLIGNYSKKAIRVNTDAKIEYNRLRQDSSFIPLSQIDNPSKGISLALLNVRSLRKHAIDIAFDKQFCKVDMLCFTETQLSPNSGTDDIENMLDIFQIEFNNSEHSKFQSLAICHKPVIVIEEHLKSSGFSLLKFKKESFSSQYITILLIYRPPNQSKALFYDNISQFLQFNNVDIILGDFNIDALDSTNDDLENLFASYEMIVREPTHLSGGLIDLAYIRKEFIYNKIVNCNIKNVYFSDHDAVCFNIYPV